MLNKIVFLCIAPLGKFSPGPYEVHGREYFQWLCSMAKLRDAEPLCREIVEIYGEYRPYKNGLLFEEGREGLQLLYVQSNCPQLLEKVFAQADLVMMEVPEYKKEFDEIFMAVFPWREQILFLRRSTRGQTELSLKRLLQEYKLREEQVMEIKRSVEKI